MSEPFVSTAWLEEHLSDPDLVVVDGSWYLPTLNRDPQAEYLAGHIPGAVRFDIDKVKDQASSLPHMLPSPEDFAAAVGVLGIGNTTQVVIYDGAGLRSAPRVRWTFRVFGVRNVAILEGGFPAWKAEGRPIETGEERPRKPQVFTPHFVKSAVADSGRILELLKSGEAQIVDARPADRFRGEGTEPRLGLRKGHMPGSLNVPFEEVLDGGRLKDAASLRQAFQHAGVDLDRPIVTSCGSGVTAAILALALETLGRPAQSLYDGSWSEWGAREDLPIETGPGRKA
ncbi:3-mercaptopyruvate sulfurtransferase [Microvirga rosea]|uniref:3-mercaptopyruvate sulfurtransferase n=1 Tax=Microvirga rosea TaxID=2715425 RepID=UPI001D09DD23|nr:3-mercaptopyruvate sulfurtransferase [Microvirga rosea]MCB8821040.1 3-mercaptopyruvate sulfurtransferase [Microvirga rosea]